VAAMSSAGVFTQAAPLAVPLKWVSTSTTPAAQCHYEPKLHVPLPQAAQVQ